MPQIITRAGKGSALSHPEMDANWSRTVRAVTGTDSVVASDNRNLIECNHASTPFTVTMITVALAAAEDTDGFETSFFNIGAAVASIDADSAETINGATAAITLKQYDGVTLKLNSAGDGWDTVARVGDLGAVDVTTLDASGAVTVSGAFTSLGIDDNATSERVQITDTRVSLGTGTATYYINHVNNDAALRYGGGDASGAGSEIILWGGAHASANDVQVRANDQIIMHWDDSAGDLEIKTGQTTTSTALTLDTSQNATFAAAATVTGALTASGGVDGVLGGVTPAAVTGTTLDGIIGSVTPAAVTATDVTITGDITYDSIVQPKVKIVDIGDWNMDSTNNVNVAHGLTLANIRSVQVLIRNDTAANSYDFLAMQASGLALTLDATNVGIQRLSSGFFDGADFDATTYNRGWITIQYV